MSKWVIAMSSIGWLLSVGCSDDKGEGTGKGPDVGADVLGDDTADTTQVQDSVADTTPQDTSRDTSTPDTTTQDTRPDTAPDVSDIPDPNIAPDPGKCSSPGGSLNIYDLQNPDCPDHPTPEPTGSEGLDVDLEGVIVTGTYGDTMFVQDPGGGPYSGITIFNHNIYTGDLEVGDRVDVSGSYSEFFENSQIYLDSIDFVSAGDEPEPYVPAHPSHIATNGPLAEMFEGVLVRVEDVVTVHTRPDCPQEYGEFAVSGDLRIDDMGYHWDARLGDHFESITGPLLYAFGNFKIEPRTEADLVWTTKGASTGISKCIATECQALDSDPGTKQIVINEVMPDPFMSDADQEWIELYNPTQSAVDITGWQIRDCGDQAVSLIGGNLTMPPGGYLVIGMNVNFAKNGGVPMDLAYGQSFYMANTVGSVLLYESDAFDAPLVDQMRYSRFAPWDVLQGGHSLERTSPTNDGTLPESWATGSSDFGTNGNYGTPGARNDAAQ